MTLALLAGALTDNSGGEHNLSLSIQTLLPALSVVEDLFFVHVRIDLGGRDLRMTEHDLDGLERDTILEGDGFGKRVTGYVEGEGKVDTADGLNHLQAAIDLLIRDTGKDRTARSIARAAFIFAE